MGEIWYVAGGHTLSHVADTAGLTAHAYADRNCHVALRKYRGTDHGKHSRPSSVKAPLTSSCAIRLPSRVFTSSSSSSSSSSTPRKHRSSYSTSCSSFPSGFRLSSSSSSSPFQSRYAIIKRRSGRPVASVNCRKTPFFGQNPSQIPSQSQRTLNRTLDQTAISPSDSSSSSSSSGTTWSQQRRREGLAASSRMPPHLHLLPNLPPLSPLRSLPHVHPLPSIHHVLPRVAHRPRVLPQRDGRLAGGERCGRSPVLLCRSSLKGVKYVYDSEGDGWIGGEGVGGEGGEEGGGGARGGGGEPDTGNANGSGQSIFSQYFIGSADGRKKALYPLILQIEDNHYGYLGIDPLADLETIKNAFRRLSKMYHPDTSTLPLEVSAEKFVRLKKAYSTLSNEKKRREYDKQLMAIAAVQTQVFANTSSASSYSSYSSSYSSSSSSSSSAWRWQSQQQPINDFDSQTQGPENMSSSSSSSSSYNYYPSSASSGYGGNKKKAKDGGDNLPLDDQTMTALGFDVFAIAVAILSILFAVFAKGARL